MGDGCCVMYSMLCKVLLTDALACFLLRAASSVSSILASFEGRRVSSAEKSLDFFCMVAESSELGVKRLAFDDEPNPLGDAELVTLGRLADDRARGLFEVRGAGVPGADMFL